MALSERLGDPAVRSLQNPLSCPHLLSVRLLQVRSQSKLRTTYGPDRDDEARKLQASRGRALLA